MDISYYKKYEPIFGSWHIVREIGEGSFGKVFEIEREDFGTTYRAALKAITVPRSQSDIEQIMQEMNCSNKKAVTMLSELEKKVALFEKKRQGLGKPNLIYVKNFFTANQPDCEYEQQNRQNCS